jgi:hypothetical protein
MENYFDIEKLFKKQISGHCFPYINKEFYEVNEELGKLLQDYISENSSIQGETRIDFNSMEYQTYVQLFIVKLTGEEFKKETIIKKYYEGIVCSVSVLAPVFSISIQQWDTTLHLSNNQIIESLPTPGFTIESDFSSYQYECKTITNFLQSKGLVSFQDVTILFPEVEKNVLFKALFFIND